jgi:hypothetical protein
LYIERTTNDVEGRRQQRSERQYWITIKCNYNCYTIYFNINYAIKSYLIIWRDDDGAVVVVVVAEAVKPGRRRSRRAFIVDFPLCITTRESRTTTTKSTLSAAVPFGNNQQ